MMFRRRALTIAQACVDQAPIGRESMNIDGRLGSSRCGEGQIWMSSSLIDFVALAEAGSATEPR